MFIVRSTSLLAIVVLLPAVGLCYTSNDIARTISTDGSATDTQNGINYMVGKAQDGWVITVGTAASTYNWAASVSVPAGFVHSYTIQGAGSGATRSKIVSTHSNYASFTISTNDGKLARLTNFIFNSTGTQSGGFLTINPPTNGIAHQSFRVDNCRFQDCHDFAVRISDANQNEGTTYGLFDHDDFYETFSGNGIYIFAGNNANQWKTNMTWGTVDTVVIEDCTFTCTSPTVPGNPAIDSAYNGARWCARHNTFANWVCVLHGADSAPTSTLQVEFHHNTMTVDISDYGLYCRGGCIMASSNTFLPSSAFPNQVFRFANDSPGGFQKVGNGAVNGVETRLGAYFWNNNPNFLGAIPSALSIGANIFAAAPGPGLPTASYTELVYPHPLQRSPAPSSKLPAPPSNLRVIGQ